MAELGLKKNQRGENNQVKNDISRQSRKKNEGKMDRDLLLNGSGYRDPTAYKALRKCTSEDGALRKCNTCENFGENEVVRKRISESTEETEHEKFQRFLRDLFDLCGAYTYHLESRIVVRDKKNGRIWR